MWIQNILEFWGWFWCDWLANNSAFTDVYYSFLLFSWLGHYNTIPLSVRDRIVGSFYDLEKFQGVLANLVWTHSSKIFLNFLFRRQWVGLRAYEFWVWVWQSRLATLGVLERISNMRTAMKWIKFPAGAWIRHWWSSYKWRLDYSHRYGFARSVVFRFPQNGADLCVMLQFIPTPSHW